VVVSKAAWNPLQSVAIRLAAAIFAAPRTGKAGVIKWDSKLLQKPLL